MSNIVAKPNILFKSPSGDRIDASSSTRPFIIKARKDKNINFITHTAIDTHELILDTSGNLTIPNQIKNYLGNTIVDSHNSNYTFYGNLLGNTVGLHNGNVTGNLTGDVTGNITGNVTGDVTGNLTGDVTGNITGNITGDVTGNLTGNVIGVIGNLQNANAGTFTNLSADSILVNSISISTSASLNGSLSVSGDTTLTGNLAVTGNLTITGTTTTVNATNLEIKDPLIYIATGNSANVNDIGIVGHFNNGTYQHTGLVRDASENVWKLFSNVTTEPTSTIDFTNAEYDSLRIGTLYAYSVGLESILDVYGSATFYTNAHVNGQFIVSDLTDSSSTTTGAVQVRGGLGVEKTIYAATINATTINDSKGEIRRLPSNNQTSAYTLVSSDAGKHINITTGGVTVPQNIGSIGDSYVIYNNSSSNQTITQGTGVTLYLGGTSTTGNRTLQPRGLATILCVATSVYVIAGAGVI